MAKSDRQFRNFADNVSSLEFMKWNMTPYFGNNGKGLNGPIDRHGSLPHSVEVKRFPRLSERSISAHDMHCQITRQGIPQPGAVNIRIREPYGNKRNASTLRFD